MIPRIRPMVAAVAGAVVLAATGACGSFRGDGTASPPNPADIVPRLFDPTAIYAEMGFFAKGEPVAFVATLRSVATGSPDTALAIFGLSLANSTLSFRRSGQAFEAEYHVDVAFRRDGVVVQRFAADERVLVASRQEAHRADESVVFQQFVRVPAGAYRVTVSVRDRRGGSFAEATHELEIPRFRDRVLSDLIPIYEGTIRDGRDDLPPLLVNPRATVPYGLDSLTLYIEGYGAPGTALVEVRATSLDNEPVWSTRAPLVARTEGLGGAIVRIPPQHLPVGELLLTAALVESDGDSASARALVSFSDQWVITNFADILSLLRYFGEEEAVAAMRDAAPADQPELWRAFWRDTDPDRITPENEALTEYFRRLQIANRRFQETGGPGWLTDRGEVYISLGEPDDVFSQSSALEGQRRVIRWDYYGERLTVDFVDETGFGRFRLTPISRTEFQRVLSRVRSER